MALPDLRAATIINAKNVGTNADVTGRRHKREFRVYRSIFNSFRESQGAVSGAATVRATVLDNRFMPVLAYNECSAGNLRNRNSTTMATDPFNWFFDRGLSDNNVCHRFTTSFVWEMPAFRRTA